MSNLDLVERDFESFFAVPFLCYGSRSKFVSLMKSDLRRHLSDENPLFARYGEFTFFTVRRDGVPVGRIVVHIHRESNRVHGLKLGYFGYFDCADDEEAAALLLRTAERWLAVRGCDRIAGNFNLTAMQQIGVVTDGFEHAPYTDMVYNPPHIPRLLTACGYQPYFPMRTWETDVPPNPLSATAGTHDALGDGQRAAAGQSRLAVSSNLIWGRVRRRGFMRTLEQIRRLINESFVNNPMFVPITSDEFSFQAKEMMWIVDHRITQLVYEGDSLVGAVLCIPDLNPFVRATGSRFRVTTPWHFMKHRANCDRAVILLLAVKPSQQNEGICGAMLYRLGADLRNAGYKRVGGTWISDENPASLKQVERFASRKLHSIHLFAKQLG